MWEVNLKIKYFSYNVVRYYILNIKKKIVNDGNDDNDCEDCDNDDDVDDDDIGIY